MDLSQQRTKGYLRGGIEHKVSLYADDLLFYVSDLLNWLPTMSQRLDKLGKLFGHNIHLVKSKMFLIQDEAIKLNYDSLPSGN